MDDRFRMVLKCLKLCKAESGKNARYVSRELRSPLIYARVPVIKWKTLNSLSPHLYSCYIRTCTRTNMFFDISSTQGVRAGSLSSARNSFPRQNSTCWENIRRSIGITFTQMYAHTCVPSLCCATRNHEIPLRFLSRIPARLKWA